MSDNGSAEIHMNAQVSAQFSYHVRMAAMFAIAGNNEESDSEAVLAWAMLSSCCPGAAAGASAVAAELIDPERLATTDGRRHRAEARARDLALSLEAHYVSVGQHATATMYESVAAGIGSS